MESIDDSLAKLLCRAGMDSDNQRLWELYLPVARYWLHSHGIEYGKSSDQSTPS